MPDTCPRCDAAVGDDANYCPNCGQPLSDDLADATVAPVTDFDRRAGHNVVGLVGFIVSIVAAATSWIYIYGWIVWLVGLVLSIIGVFYRPRGFAYWGVVISIVGFFITFGVYSANLGAGMFYWY